MTLRIDNFKDTVENNLKKEAAEMKKALEEIGTRINSNLEIIGHLKSDNCLKDKNYNYQIMKNQLAVAIDERAKTFTDSIIQCGNGEH